MKTDSHPTELVEAPGARIAAALAHPLDAFYAAIHIPLPPLQEMHPAEVPAPYRQLLVHKNDMTPTLEHFFGRSIHLRVLGRRQQDDAYFREVTLLLDGTEQPVAFGAIKIRLDRFAAKARKHVLEEQRPLGHILLQDGIVHSCEPKAFFRVASDRTINDALSLHGVQVLFGRRNTLLAADGGLLAEVVEILPPISIPSHDP